MSQFDNWQDIECGEGLISNDNINFMINAFTKKVNTSTTPEATPVYIDKMSPELLDTAYMVFIFLIKISSNRGGFMKSCFNFHQKPS